MSTTNSMGQRYYNKAYTALTEGKNQDAVNFLKLAAINFKRDYDRPMLIKATNLLAVVYSILDDDAGMASAISDGLKYCDEYGLRGAKNLFYNALSDRYMALNDAESALKYGIMTVENLEKFGKEFDNPPAAFMVAYLNTSCGFLKTGDAKNAEIYLNKAIEYAHSNDIHQHDYAFNALMCSIKHLADDDDYVKKNTPELLSITANGEITITDYIQDIEIAVDVLVGIKDYASALKLVDALNKTLDENSAIDLRLSISKLFMKIYKENGDREKYYSACDLYISDDMAIREKKALDKLNILNI